MRELVGFTAEGFVGSYITKEILFKTRTLSMETLKGDDAFHLSAGFVGQL
jgi:hypothetical protein